MDLSALRMLALNINLSVHGVAATVTRPAPDNTPVVTTGIWVNRPLEEERPYGTDFQARRPRLVMALPRSALSTMPRGTTVVAPEQQGGANKTWKVDELDRTETDHWRVVLVASN